MTIGSDRIRGREAPVDVQFPQAPAEWSQAAALELARREGLEPGDDHWEVVRCLQQYFARHEDGRVNLRDLHDALEEKFHHKGGLRYLYAILPGGPVAQGCRLAGLKPPGGAVDSSYGSVA